MKIYAHRGFSGKYPENTMLAFEKAVEVGCDGIELDIQITNDNVVVIFHDESINRTTDGKGFIRDYTYNELEKYNAAFLYGKKYGFEPIPTLDNYCKWVKDKNIITNIEIKSGVYYYENLEKEAVSIVKKYEIENQIIFSSFNHMSLIKVKDIDSSLKCAALVKLPFGNVGFFCNQSGFEFYHPSFDILTDEVAEECKKAGISINVWVIDNLKQLEQLEKWSCSGVITNYPDIFIPR